MRVFKFGGASIKDPQQIRNVLHVLQTVGYKDSIIIASAMGKTTNALEEVVDAYFNNQTVLQSKLQIVKDYHFAIVEDLFADKTHTIYNQIDGLFAEIETFFELKNPRIIILFTIKLLVMVKSFQLLF